ncbi:MAG: DUF72 domain-containing protein [Flavitalea sp.]
MGKIKKGGFFCGTSNIVLQGNKSTFPPEMQNKSRLTYYSTIFNSLEVNASFYKIPKKKTFGRWAGETHSDFRFTIKVWKEISHARGLNFKSEDLSLFMEAVAGTGDKLGCLLLQLPKSTGVANLDKLEDLLNQVTESQSEQKIRIALELRNPDWYTEDSRRLFSKKNVSLVQHDMPGSAPGNLPGNPSFVVLRFHGPQGDYRGNYGEQLLLEKATKARQWINSGKDVYAYFNNTIGDAYTDTLNFMRLVNSDTAD